MLRLRRRRLRRPVDPNGILQREGGQASLCVISSFSGPSLANGVALEPAGDPQTTGKSTALMRAILAAVKTVGNDAKESATAGVKPPAWELGSCRQLSRTWALSISLRGARSLRSRGGEAMSRHLGTDRMAKQAWRFLRGSGFASPPTWLAGRGGKVSLHGDRPIQCGSHCTYMQIGSLSKAPWLGGSFHESA